MPRAPTRKSTRTLAASRAPTRAIELEERGQRSVSPLELGLIELPTRPRSVYTMGARKAAIEECEQGLLRSAADLTLAAITESGYCRGILADLVQGILGLPRTFVGRADMISALDDTPERIGQFREMFPDADTVRLLSWGITLGVAPGQMRRKYGARPSYDYPITPEEAADWRNVRKLVGSVPSRPIGAHDVRSLRAWSPKWLRCQWWEDSSWYLMTADGEIRISHLDDPKPAKNAWGDPFEDGNRDEWMLFTPFCETKPWEWGSWKSATLAFIAERDATFDRLRHSEVLAPARVGSVPQGTTERQRRQFLRLIREMQRMPSFVLPAGLDYKIVESTGRVAEVYKAIIEWAERQYAMITGALTTATGTKGFSKGDVQERFTRSILSAFASALSSCFHLSALVPWARGNYGTDDAPRAEWDPTPPDDKKTKAETLAVAAGALDKLADAMAKHDRKLSDNAVERYMQSLGFETQALPVRTPHPHIDISVEARKYAYTLDEIRAGDGWPGMGDDRGTMTPGDAEALAKRKAGATPEPSAGADPGVAPGDAPTDEAAMALAAKMTEHGIERCGHDHPNRCPLCGVERLRDFDIDEEGKPRWHIAWRPIVRAKVAPAEPAATAAATSTPVAANGAGHPTAWALGGDA